MYGIPTPIAPPLFGNRTGLQHPALARMRAIQNLFARLPQGLGPQHLLGRSGLGMGAGVGGFRAPGFGVPPAPSPGVVPSADATPGSDAYDAWYNQQYFPQSPIPQPQAPQFAGLSRPGLGGPLRPSAPQGPRPSFPATPGLGLSGPNRRLGGF